MSEIGYRHLECENCGTEIGFSEVYLERNGALVCSGCDIAEAAKERLRVHDFSIRTDRFELKGYCSIPPFDKRGVLVLRLVQVAVEQALEFCEGMSESALGGEHIDWKQEDEILSAFMDVHTGFPDWMEKVAKELNKYSVELFD